MENEENVRNFRKRSRKNSVNSKPSKVVKPNTSKSELVNLENSIENLISFQSQFHPVEKQIENRVETQIRLNIKKRPESSIIVIIKSILAKQKSVDLYEEYRHLFANTFGKIWLEVFKSDCIDVSNISGVMEMCPHDSKIFQVANPISSLSKPQSEQEILKVLFDCLEPRLIHESTRATAEYAKPLMLEAQNTEQNEFSSPPSSIEEFDIPNVDIGGVPNIDVSDIFGDVCFVERGEVTPSPEQIYNIKEEPDFDNDEFLGEEVSDDDVPPVLHLNSIIMQPIAQSNPVHYVRRISSSPLLEPYEGTFYKQVFFSYLGVFNNHVKNNFSGVLKKTINSLSFEGTFWDFF